ncbi:methyltransferase domain-containing protein [Deltaproteobacteria bacterium TL4]
MPKSGKTLDIGAGTGRDAAWLVRQGLSVFAVEPVAAMRQQAEVFHPEAGIHWIDDTLPHLKKTGALGAQDCGFKILDLIQEHDKIGRKNVSWETLVLKKLHREISTKMAIGPLTESFTIVLCRRWYQALQLSQIHRCYLSIRRNYGIKLLPQ